MIQKTELRIGNLVYIPGSDSTDEIEELRTEGAFLLNSGGYVKYEELQPVPLTAEWLEKLGFETIGGWRYRAPLTITDKWIELDGYCHDYNGAIIELDRCQYVHQLQNLYHALTGQELPTQ